MEVCVGMLWLVIHQFVAVRNTSMSTEIPQYVVVVHGHRSFCDSVHRCHLQEFRNTLVAQVCHGRATEPWCSKRPFVAHVNFVPVVPVVLGILVESLLVPWGKYWAIKNTSASVTMLVVPMFYRCIPKDRHNIELCNSHNLKPGTGRITHPEEGFGEMSTLLVIASV